MRLISALALTALAGSVHAAGMSAIPQETGYCAAQDRDAICHEWKLTSDPGIRFVAFGYEDGVEYGFFALKRGKYKHLVQVYPALQDPGRPESLFWGYPWDIADIAVDPSGKRVMATFEHSLDDDGEVYSPAWQKQIPVVLFVGSTTQPQMTAPPLSFAAWRLKALASRAGG